MGENRKNRLPEGDDGRTIADMNVDGMPWYLRDRSLKQGNGGTPEPMTKEQKRAFLWGALKASLLVAVVFIGVFFLFILFCEKVWFR